MKKERENRSEENQQRDVDHRRPKMEKKGRQDPKQLLRAGRYEELYDEE